jgi:pyrroloquinoline quinone biosynthesis protein B
VAVYAPSVSAWDPALVNQLAGAECVFVDGTFWTDDEMARGGTGSPTGRSMGHLPISGPDGSAVRLAELADVRRIYTHINNTQDTYQQHQPDPRRGTRATGTFRAGIDVGRAGLEIEL